MTDLDETQAHLLHSQGLSCRAIATQLGVNPSTVSRWARRKGLVFDRAQSAMATRARQIDLAASRTELTQKMLAAAHDLLDNIDQPHLVWSFGGRDNSYQEHLLDETPIEIRRSIFVIAGIAFDKASKILDVAPDAALDNSKSLLGRLATSLGLNDTDTTDDAATLPPQTRAGAGDVAE